jgi:hypothetical protein
MRYKIEATIPTTQYGNIRPTFEVESDEEQEQAVQALTKMWERFGESPLKDKQSGGVEVETFTGENIIWNEATHTYTDLQGNVLLSGSAYANQHSPKFDLEMMLPKTSKAWEVPEEELRSIWKFNGDIANHWGSAVHMALELYHKHEAVGAKVQKNKELDENYVMPKNSYLRKIVKEFIEMAGTDALCEVLVSDVANGMAGTIDRLKITGEKTCRIGDYKTNNEMDKKKLLKYQKQLSFYAHILINKGWTVEGIDLYYLNTDDGWSLETLEILPLE